MEVISSWVIIEAPAHTGGGMWAWAQDRHHEGHSDARGVKEAKTVA